MVEGFQPIIDKNCQILILGTMPSVKSMEKQEYYGNPRNQFWKIIFSLFKEEYMEDYGERIKFLRRKHIALWDVLKSCDRQGSSDSRIKNPVSNDFQWLFSQYPKIKSIYFNGKTAEKLYKRLVGTWGENITLQSLPSTSPANTISLSKKLQQWKEILDSLYI